MKKGFRETMLQLVLSPVNLFLNDNYQVVRQCLCGCIVEVVLVVKLNPFLVGIFLLCKGFIKARES